MADRNSPFRFGLPPGIPPDLSVLDGVRAHGRKPVALAGVFDDWGEALKDAFSKFRARQITEGEFIRLVRDAIDSVKAEASEGRP